MQVLSIPKKKRIHALAFSPSGREIAAACGDDTARVWDLSSGKLRQSIDLDHTSDGYDILYLDEDRLVVAGPGLRWWDIPANGWNDISGRPLWRRQLSLSADRRQMIVADAAESVDWHNHSGLFVFDTADWSSLPRLEEPELTTGGIDFSPDGRLFASGHIVRVGVKQRSAGNFGTYNVNDYDYWVHIREWPSGRVIQTSEGWQNTIHRLSFSPDSKVLAGAAGQRLRIWDVEENRELALHERGRKHFQDLAFTCDGRYLATVSNDETVRIWDTGSWQEHTTFTWQIGKMLNIALAPDGLRAAAGSDKGQIVIWDLDD